MCDITLSTIEIKITKIAHFSPDLFKVYRKDGLYTLVRKRDGIFLFGHLWFDDWQDFDERYFAVCRKSWKGRLWNLIYKETGEFIDINKWFLSISRLSDGRICAQSLKSRKYTILNEDYKYIKIDTWYDKVENFFLDEETCIVTNGKRKALIYKSNGENVFKDNPWFVNIKGLGIAGGEFLLALYVADKKRYTLGYKNDGEYDYLFPNKFFVKVELVDKDLYCGYDEDGLGCLMSISTKKILYGGKRFRRWYIINDKYMMVQKDNHEYQIVSREDLGVEIGNVSGNCSAIQKASKDTFIIEGASRHVGHSVYILSNKNGIKRKLCFENIIKCGQFSSNLYFLYTQSNELFKKAKKIIIVDVNTNEILGCLNAEHVVRLGNGSIVCISSNSKIKVYTSIDDFVKGLERY